MRLLIVIPKLVSYRSFLRELCRSLVADGDEVHVACSLGKSEDSESQCAKDGVRFHAIEFPRGMNPAAHWKAAQALRKLVGELRPDIIHAHFSSAIFTTAIARTSRWPATMATFHGVSFPAMSGWKAALLRMAETWAARRFDTVWVLTDDDRACLQTAARSAVVRRLPGYGMGCDLERFAQLPAAARDSLRSQAGLRPDEIVFAFLGRFTDFKGFGHVARAFFQIATGNSKLRLLLIGSRDRIHPTGLSEAEERLLKDSPQVIDVGFRTDVERWLALADVMIFPSRREGMPVCLMESLALGVPVITLDSRGCRDVVRDGIDGLVLGDPSVECLSAAMARIAEDHELRTRWVAHAIAGRDRFSRDHFVAAQTHIYRDAALAAHRGELSPAR